MAVTVTIQSEETVTLTTDISGDISKHKYSKGEVISEPPVPKLEDGLAFRGWTTNPNDLSDTFDFTQPLTEDLILYAIVVVVPPEFNYGAAEHIVQFKYNVETVEMSYVLVNHLQSVASPQIKNIDGYVFDSWYVDSGYIERANINVPITSDVVFYGKYDPIGKDVVKIFLDCDKGAIDGKGQITLTVDKGTTYQSALDGISPICDGHLFDGWYTDKTYTSRIVPTGSIDKDVYIYANWKSTLAITKYDGTKIDDVNNGEIASNNVYWDGKTIYVRLATVSGSMIASGPVVMGNGGAMSLSSSSTSMTSATITRTVINSTEEIIRQPHFIISGMNISVGLPKVVEASVEFSFDNGDTTTRSLEAYVDEESSSKSSALTSGVTFSVNSENGLFYRIAQVCTYQIIQSISVEDISNPNNPKYSVGYEIRMSPIVFQLQCSDDVNFISVDDNNVRDLDETDIKALINKYITEGDMTGMNKVILHSGLPSGDVRYCFIKDGEKLSEKSRTFFDDKNPGNVILGWSSVSVDSTGFNRSAIFNEDSAIKEDMDLYAIWIPERLNEAGYTPICNEQELGGINNDLSGRYVLVKDLVLTMPWIPIGSTADSTSFFHGILDGAGHTISKLRISDHFNTEYIRTMGDGGDNYAFVGLFAKLGNSSEVSNLVFEDVSIRPTISSGWMSAGVLAGCTYGSQVHDIIIRSGDVYFSTTSARTIVGGIIGIVEEGTVIKDCIAESSLSVYGKGNKATAGGIAGSLEGECTIQYCVNQAYINCDGINDYAASGGIAGGMKFKGTKTVSYCYNSGQIETHCYKNRDSGSIVGRSWQGNESTSIISSCYLLEGVLIEGKTVQKTYSVDGGRDETVKTSNNFGPITK